MIFFFTHTASSEIHTLSLHDALPIYVTASGRDSSIADRLGVCRDQGRAGRIGHVDRGDPVLTGDGAHRVYVAALDRDRSEEHTSELQSQSNLVCRLLLEKKKNRT